MELDLFSEAASCTATQYFPTILCNPNIHYRAHKSPPLVPVVSQINPVHTTASYLRSILILFSKLYVCLMTHFFLAYFCGEESAPRPAPNMSAVRDCLFNIFCSNTHKHIALCEFRRKVITAAWDHWFEPLIELPSSFHAAEGWTHVLIDFFVMIRYTDIYSSCVPVPLFRRLCTFLCN
jgi:hypothetical protein